MNPFFISLPFFLYQLKMHHLAVMSLYTCVLENASAPQKRFYNTKTAHGLKTMGGYFTDQA
jgi:hypothetical protein